MLNSVKPFLTGIALLLVFAFIIGSCTVERAPTEFKFKYSGVSAFHVKSQPVAGLYTIDDGRVSHVLDSFLTKTNIKRNLAVTMKLDSLVFRIPNDINIDFSSYSDAKLVIKNPNAAGAAALDSIVVILPNVTGKVNKVFPEASQLGKTYDISSMAQSPGTTFTVYYRTNKATPYLTVNMQYSMDLSFTQNPYN